MGIVLYLLGLFVTFFAVVFWKVYRRQLRYRKAGYTGKQLKLSGFDLEDLIFMGATLSVFWPITVPIIIAIGIFQGLVRLSERIVDSLYTQVKEVDDEF